MTVNLNWFWAVVVVEVSEVNENVADIMGLSAASGCLVNKFLHVVEIVFELALCEEWNRC